MTTTLPGPVPAAAAPPPDPGRAARVAAHAARVAREDPGDEPGRCWGPCGRVLPRPGRPEWHGWAARPCPGVPGATELHCPECFRRWGFVTAAPRGDE